MTGTMYFIANRLWWAGALFIAPVAAAVADSVVIGIVVLAGLLLAALLVFDTGRPWWSDEVKSLPQDRDRSRRELLPLTASAAVGLVLGLVAGLLVA
jgi:hypothetical protein